MEKLLSTIHSVASQVRDELLQNYGLPLYGLCIEASELIKERLHVQGIEVTDQQGWCIYQLPDTHYGRKYGPHVWCEYCTNDELVYIDVTLDQFQSTLKDVIPPVFIGSKPIYMVYDRPTYLNKYL